MKISVAFVAFLMLLLLLPACTRESSEAVARRLNAEFQANVPLQSAKAKVIDFLKMHHIEFYDDPVNRIVTASIRDVQRGFLVRSGVYMEFRFDVSNRLTAYQIRSISTGP
ncbi:MAG: hypothetical protein JWO56_2887 [Acidobacteria bacterium]|nr:hypothetical protein [Acidobacteriota bacterium]